MYLWLRRQPTMTRSCLCKNEEQALEIFFRTPGFYMGTYCGCQDRSSGSKGPLLGPLLNLYPEFSGLSNDTCDLARIEALSTIIGSMKLFSAATGFCLSL